MGKYLQVEEHSRVQGRCLIWLSCGQWSNQEYSWKMPGLTSRHNVMERWHGSKKTFRDNHRGDLTIGSTTTWKSTYGTYGATSNLPLLDTNTVTKSWLQRASWGGVCAVLQGGGDCLVTSAELQSLRRAQFSLFSLFFFFFNLSPTQKLLWTKPGAQLALGITWKSVCKEWG